MSSGPCKARVCGLCVLRASLCLCVETKPSTQRHKGYTRGADSAGSWRRLAGVFGLVLALSWGHARFATAQAEQATQPKPAENARGFTDVTAAAGLRFRHHTGAFGKKYLPETLGPGCAFLDYDGDGWPDIFLPNGRDWPGRRRAAPRPALYRNNRNGAFTNVTRAAGLAVEMYALGAAAADYDNDGDQDLFVTALGQSRLFQNNGKGAFTDVTQMAGLTTPPEFSTGAAWVDFDKDGRLDLLIGNYVQWTPETDIFCTLDGVSKSYCTPESYQGASARLWRGRSDGAFEDVTRMVGLHDPTSKTLGVAVLDFNQDGWPDLLLANDTQPNKLYENSGKGAFLEKGLLAGVAFSEEGVARAGMGVDAADYDRSGYPSILISNFSNQMLALYHNEGHGLFVDEAPRSEVGRASLLSLGFAVFFFDFDLDGWLDIFVANGHIENEIERIQPRVKYAQAPHLFRNTGAGKFEDVARKMGPAFAARRVARGAAYADYDNDGDLDLLVTTNGGPAVLFRNDAAVPPLRRSGSSGPPGLRADTVSFAARADHSLRIRLAGVKSNRSGLGAVVRVTAGGATQWQMLRSGSSYLSQSELVLTFGLGGLSLAGPVEVRWPSGAVDRLARVAAGQTVTITEGRGQTAAVPFLR